MRVKFIRDYKGGKGEESYTKGQVLILDQGLADQLVREGYAEAFPYTDAEVAEQATKYYAGDDKRTPEQIADRVPQVVLLQGDTRSDVEEQRGEDDPHEVRKGDEKIAEAAVETKLEKLREAREEGPSTPAETGPKADERSRPTLPTRKPADK